MYFHERNHFLRKSDPTYRNKKTKETPYPDYIDSNANIKRKGASLARPGIHRQDSLVSSGRDHCSKRISALDSSKLDSLNLTSGTKLLNLIKSSFNLNKSKSKSKVNISETRQSLYSQATSSKSEENLNGFKNEIYYHIIKSSNLVLKPVDKNLYVKEYNHNNEEIIKPLILLTNDCLVQPLHPSIANCQNFCFQIFKQEPVMDITKPFFSNNNNPTMAVSMAKSMSYNSTFCSLKCGPVKCDSTYTIRCSSTSETNEWITRLKKHINPNYENTIRHEDVFKVWIQEAKNLINKKRYYCEIKLDNMLYGKTTIKTMSEMVFWGEEFEFRGLQNINAVSVSLYRMIDGRRKENKSELVAQINVSCSEFTESSFVERWYSPSPDIRFSTSSNLPPEYEEILKSVIDCTPTIRIKGRYRPLEILPLNLYESLSDYLIKNSIPLVESLESHLKVKSKEDFVKILLLILESKDSHIEFLSDLVMLEVSKAEDNLILRGNSVASKAMESYLKLIGEKYITSLLTELINQVNYETVDCEVDPIRLPSGSSSIVENQQKLLNLVEKIWNKIYINSHLVPKDLKLVFSKIREKLSASKRVSSCSSPMIDQVISSCLFLRFICPAIMSPFLFGLSPEYSDKTCINRTFTLIAKCIQSLANFSQFPQSKETYMEFMQNFINTNSNKMRAFLIQISSINTTNDKSNEMNVDLRTKSFLDTINLQTKPDRYIDIGYHLAELLFQLNVHLKEIPENEYTTTLREIRNIMENISRMSAFVDPGPSNSVNKTSHYANINSRIPILNGKTDKVPVEVKNKPKSLANNSLANPSMKPKRKLSLPKKETDLDENFSYIPVRNNENKTYLNTKKNFSSNDNYVDFEHCEFVVDDDPFKENSLLRSNKYNYLNEEKINDDWVKMVKECNKNSSNFTSPVLEDSNNTFNSSGYQSLTKLSPDDLENSTFHPNLRYGNSNNDPFNNSLTTSLPVKSNPSKTNAIRRVQNCRGKKKSSPVTKSSFNSSDLKNSQSFNSRPQTLSNQIPANISYSHETLEYLENLSGSENQSLSGSKSYLSLYQKKLHDSNSNLISNNLEKQVTESHESSDCSLSSKRNLSKSSQSISNSSTIMDLDPLILNEKERVNLLLEFYKIPRPSLYEGTAVDQYKQRTTDENSLVNFFEKKSKMGQSDINSYLPAAYRLVKSFHQKGKLPRTLLTKYLIYSNHWIQKSWIGRGSNENPTESHLGSSESKSVKTNKPKISKNHRDLSSLSTHSLPFPSSKYSK